jgi:tetratricopeptide (TPR) repeat protein
MKLLPPHKPWRAVLLTLTGLLLLLFVVHPARGQELAPLADEALKREAERLIEAGRLGAARTLVESAVAARGATPAALYLQAKLLFKERKFAASVGQLERLLRDDQGGEAGAAASRPRLALQLQAAAYQLLGLNLVQLNRLDLAEECLRTAAELAPADHLNRYHLGMLYFVNSRFAAAERELREAVRLSPAFAPGHDALGLALEELGQEAAALAAYRRAVELSESQRLRDAAPHLNMGKFLLSKNRAEESLAPLKRATELDRRSAEAAFQLGKAHNKLGQSAEAVRALLRAAEADPAYAEPHYLLSRIYSGQGREDEAKREMELFQRLRQGRDR